MILTGLWLLRKDKAMSDNVQYFLCVCAGFATLCLYLIFLQGIGDSYPLERIAEAIRRIDCR